MTWAEFNTQVRVFLTTHNRRQGIQAMIDSLIKAAAIDLQTAIPALKVNPTVIMPPSRFVTVSFCGKVRYPVGSKIIALYARDPDDHSKMYDFTVLTTQSGKRDIMEGNFRTGERRAFFESGELFVTPNPKDDGSEVVLEYAGVRADFEKDDEVKFNDVCVLAAGEFVMARLARAVDSDVALAQSYAGSYASLKRRIKSEANDAASIKSQ